MIRPILTYGCMVFSLVAKAHLEKMQVFQNQILHKFVKAICYVYNDATHNDLNVRPFFMKLKNWPLNFRDRFTNQNLALL